MIWGAHPYFWVDTHIAYLAQKKLCCFTQLSFSGSVKTKLTHAWFKQPSILSTFQWWQKSWTCWYLTEFYFYTSQLVQDSWHHTVLYVCRLLFLLHLKSLHCGKYVALESWYMNSRILSSPKHSIYGLFTYIWLIFYGKCRQIYHALSVWECVSSGWNCQLV